MVSSINRKMDKSTVLKSTISFLKSHNGIKTKKKQKTKYKNSFPKSFYFISKLSVLFFHKIIEIIYFFFFQNNINLSNNELLVSYELLNERINLKDFQMIESFCELFNKL